MPAGPGPGTAPAPGFAAGVGTPPGLPGSPEIAGFSWGAGVAATGFPAGDSTPDVGRPCFIGESWGKPVFAPAGRAAGRVSVPWGAVSASSEDGALLGISSFNKMFLLPGPFCSGPLFLWCHKMGMMAIHTRAIMANLKMVLTLLDAGWRWGRGTFKHLGSLFQKDFFLHGVSSLSLMFSARSMARRKPGRDPSMVGSSTQYAMRK